ncbi:Y-family DNA polymerase [Paracoccus methylarcula]|uniref:DNA-directed DNA polymerase n=1 Tax=Paracoccus methylarcula TaxID=72022 RepID=A0A3R7LQ68_9RHOB|nr:DNA polymerase Y family protein [Paracoccus methylarcula]RNF35037.1 DNA polymerase Y family protein [Paracoccus methylarcula]
MALTAADGQRLREDKPLVLITTSETGQHITALNTAARGMGFRPGMTLADARAIHPALQVAHADPAGDERALIRLALWCQCYSPFTRADPPDGISLDITGCAHLFGGEAGMMENISKRLSGFGLSARLAIAPTIGTAWGLARHAPDPCHISHPRKLRDDLAPLPIAALRLSPEIRRALEKLGLKRVGDLVDKPRAPLAARFGSQLMRRLDTAMGYEEESFTPLSPPVSHVAECRFVEPIITRKGVEIAVERLTRDLADMLEKAGKGARRVELRLFRIDGWFETVPLATSTATRDPHHLCRLLCERLDRIEQRAGFGFEAARLSAIQIEDKPAQQEDMDGPVHDSGRNDISPLLDRLVNRFGPDRVTRALPCPSHIPERAFRFVSVLEKTGTPDWPAHARTVQDGADFARPLLLLAPPEPIIAIAEAPDSPPARFEWRREPHRVTRAEGPERIAPEWWRTHEDASRTTRDYYRVEDEAGHRFWLFRDGLYERAGNAPRWFIHGIFA